MGGGERERIKFLKIKMKGNFSDRVGGGEREREEEEGTSSGRALCRCGGSFLVRH